jgi:hypothetical protein
MKTPSTAGWIVPLLGLALAAAPPVRAERLVALAEGGMQLLVFESSAPGNVLAAPMLSGLAGPGETLVGIDVRPRTSMLYGLGRIAGATDTLRVYRIDPDSGTVVPVGPGFSGVTSSAHYGFDFNPTVDRMRVVNGAGDSMRVNPDTGLRVDVMPNDTDLNPVGLQVEAVAYDRNRFVEGVLATTTLFGIARTGNQLVRVGGVNGTPSPNGGTIDGIGVLGVAIAAGSGSGFDITPRGIAYAAFTDAGTSRSTLYRIDLTSGAATAVGPIGNGSVGVSGLTSLAANDVLYAVGPGNLLHRFDSNWPERIDATRPITALALGAGERVLGIDFRPRTGQLYALGRANSGATDTLQVYRVDPVTAIASAIGVPITGITASTRYGIDFNPTVDRIRVVNGSDFNARLHPDLGVRSDTPVNDTLLNPAGGQVEGVAYDRNLDGATATTLFGISRQTGEFVTIGGANSTPSANFGQIFAIAPSFPGVSAAAGLALDVGSDGPMYAAFGDATNALPGLYRVDPTNGFPFRIGTIGDGSIEIEGFAVVLKRPRLFVDGFE